jgi:hypothetical protein
MDRKDFYDLKREDCRSLLDDAKINYYNGSNLFWLQEAVFQAVRSNEITEEVVLLLLLAQNGES